MTQPITTATRLTVRFLADEVAQMHMTGRTDAITDAIALRDLGLIEGFPGSYPDELVSKTQDAMRAAANAYRAQDADAIADAIRQAREVRAANDDLWRSRRISARKAARKAGTAL